MAEKLHDIRTAVEEWWRSSDSITILVTGKTGTGKSSLVNAILGKEVAVVGQSLDPETSEVAAFEDITEGIKVCVYDSPGLQDGRGLQREKLYLDDIERRCKGKVDLFVYCISMTTNRLLDSSDDVIAMVKLTERLGKDIWSNSIFVLTCANTLIAGIKSTIPASEKGISEKVKEQYAEKLDSWRAQIKHILFEALKLPANAIETIPIIPAGRRGLPLLFKGDTNLPWLSSLWMESLLAMKSNARPALIKMNLQRLKKVLDVRSESEFGELLQKEKLIIYDKARSFGKQLKAESEGKVVGLFSAFKEGLTHIYERAFLYHNPVIADVTVTIAEGEIMTLVEQFIRDQNNISQPLQEPSM
jgi:GTPase SAR1 family protein